MQENHALSLKGTPVLELSFHVDHQILVFWALNMQGFKQIRQGNDELGNRIQCPYRQNRHEGSQQLKNSEFAVILN